MRPRAGSLIATLIASAALTAAGCGGSSSTTVIQKTVTTTPATQPSTAQTSTSTTGSTVTPTTSTAATQPSPAAATAVLTKEGYNAADPSEYHPDQSVAVLIGVRKSSGDGYAQRAFFFAGGRYIGTDTSSDSTQVHVAYQRPPVIALNYPLYKASDPLCCPSGGTATVRYRWNGQSLQPLDSIPPASGPLSR